MTFVLFLVLIIILGKTSESYVFLIWEELLLLGAIVIILSLFGILILGIACLKWFPI